MIRNVGVFVFVATCLLAGWNGKLRAQTGMQFGMPNMGQEPLLEVPIYPVPQGMSEAEYRAANRRMGAALIRFVIPGGIHFYADERTTGWTLVGTTAGGVATLVAGLALIFSQGEQLEKTPYDTVTLGKKNVVYARVPTEIDSSGMYTYSLVPLKKERKESIAGYSLAGVGAALVAGSYLYDLIHGLVTIERKRDEVRFKYGSQLSRAMSEYEKRHDATAKVRIAPTTDPTTGSYGLAVEGRF